MGLAVGLHLLLPSWAQPVASRLGSFDDVGCQGRLASAADCLVQRQRQPPQGAVRLEPSSESAAFSEHENCMSIRHLQKIREYELDQLIPWLPKGSSILEIGAGAGWQAKALAERGYVVEAIDVAGSQYAENRVWPVLPYDGTNIPFPNRCFDVVFSSNALEHIARVERFQSEIKRVLQPKGIAIHTVPTASWRIWSNLSHYLSYVKKLLLLFFFKVCRSDRDSPACRPEKERAASAHFSMNVLRRAAFPPRHGERGSCISEICLFSRRGWNALFRRTGWSVQSYRPNRLFYTGSSILDARLGLRARHMLSYVLGSSCHTYLLRQSAPRE